MDFCGKSEKTESVCKNGAATESRVSSKNAPEQTFDKSIWGRKI